MTEAGREVDKASHSFGEWKVTKAATHSADGSKERICEVCRAEKQTEAVVVIPEKVKIDGVEYAVTSIKKDAFKNDKKVKSVTIPKSVKTIGAGAFSGCKKLKTITIKSTKISSIGKNALKGIAKNAVIKVPKAKYTFFKKKLTAKTGFKKTMKIKKY